MLSGGQNTFVRQLSAELLSLTLQACGAVRSTRAPPSQTHSSSQVAHRCNEALTSGLSCFSWLQSSWKPEETLSPPVRRPDLEATPLFPPCSCRPGLCAVLAAEWRGGVGGGSSLWLLWDSSPGKGAGSKCAGTAELSATPTVAHPPEPVREEGLTPSPQQGWLPLPPSRGPGCHPRRRGCSWLPAGGGQGGCLASHSAQNAPITMSSPPRVSMESRLKLTPVVWRLRNPALRKQSMWWKWCVCGPQTWTREPHTAPGGEAPQSPTQWNKLKAAAKCHTMKHQDH